jgi:hypothetical protein
MRSRPEDYVGKVGFRMTIQHTSHRLCNPGLCGTQGLETWHLSIVDSIAHNISPVEGNH